MIPQGPATLAKLERAVTEYVTDVQYQGYDWRDGIDALRPLTPRLWAALAIGERRRFLRERVRAWEIRRHRMAPAVGRSLHELLVSGHMTLWSGSVLAARTSNGSVEVDVVTRTSAVGASTELETPPGDLGLVRTLACERVVVCTGAGTDIECSANPLLRALLASGDASPDPLGLGLQTDDDGALRDRNGDADGRVLTLGAPRRGELWESTAVQEIRDQAEHVAHTIERSLHCSSGAGDRQLAAHTENRLNLTTRPPIPSGR
ncbi:MAG: hypothetical protein ABR992_19685 [Solirubrobacteraceae bacterium]